MKIIVDCMPSNPSKCDYSKLVEYVLNGTGYECEKSGKKCENTNDCPFFESIENYVAEQIISKDDDGNYYAKYYKLKHK